MGNTHGHQKALSAVGCPNEPVDDISNDLEELCKECDDLFHDFNLTQGFHRCQTTVATTLPLRGFVMVEPLPHPAATHPAAIKD